VRCLNLPLPLDKVAETEKYVQNSSRYYENSQALLEKKELSKAGELLWGAIAEAAKALHMIVKGAPLSSHRDLGKYLENLSLQYPKKGLKKEHVAAAHQLHINFYENQLLEDEDKFFEQYEYAKILFTFLMSLLFYR
jgi:Archaeal PaREP1/PaREP8 family